MIKQFNSNRILAFSLGVCYFWFGILKFFPGASPAENLAKETIDMLTFGFIPASVSIILLAIWETAIGVLLMANCTKKPIIGMAMTHIILTFSPMILLPELSFNGGLPTCLPYWVSILLRTWCLSAVSLFY